MPPTVTLAMIVRDESKKLARCLESAKDIVDEIVIVDTGSTDNTLEIARSFNAVTREIDWPDAFDEARNASLDLATKDWIFVLDGDEWFDPAAKPIVHSTLSNDDVCGNTIILQDLDLHGNFSEMRLLRLFRNDESIRYIGVLHEQVFLVSYLTNHPNMRTEHSQIRCFHDGYQKPASDASLRRDVKLLKKELQLRPGNLYYESILASVLMDLNDPEGPMRQKRLVDLMLERGDEESAPELQLNLIIVRELVKTPDRELSTKRIGSLIDLGFRWFSALPKVMFAVAETCIRRRAVSEAYRALKILQSMSETDEYSRYSSFPPAILNEALWFRLGIVSIQVGDKATALHALQKAVAIDLSNQIARQALDSLSS